MVRERYTNDDVVRIWQFFSPILCLNIAGADIRRVLLFQEHWLERKSKLCCL